jgi:uncharacterized OB-fold protein
MTQEVSIPSTWRTTAPRYRLAGSKCRSCDELFFPPRSICLKCRAPTDNGFSFSGFGEVLTYTVVNAAPAGFQKETPYVIGIVELEEGPRVTAQIVDIDPKDVSEGLQVQTAFRRYAAPPNTKSVITYGYKFVPRFSY